MNMVSGILVMYFIWMSLHCQVHRSTQSQYHMNPATYALHCYTLRSIGWGLVGWHGGRGTSGSGHHHWNENVVILTKFSSLAALEVVILTTFSAASDENFIKMKTFPFQWYGFVGMISTDALALTHWGRDKMDAISQTTFSNAFSWMKMFEYRLRFDLSLFLRVELTISQHWFR